MHIDGLVLSLTQDQVHQYILEKPYTVRFLPDGGAEVYFKNTLIGEYREEIQIRNIDNS